MSAETVEEALVQHRALQEETSANGTLRSVARLDVPSTSVAVRLDVDKHQLYDGPFLEAKEWLAGFYLVECKSRDEALAHAKRLVTSPGHCIEVRPVDWHRHEGSPGTHRS